MVSAVEPAWVPEKRKVKAERIAGALILHGVDAAAAAHLTPDRRRALEKAAIVRVGSDKTWRLAVEMVAGSARPLAACATCLIGDPEGIPVPPRPFHHQGPCSDGSVGRRR